MVEVIPSLVGIVIVCKLDYLVSALPEKGPQLFVLDHLNSIEMRFAIDEDERRSWLCGEVKIGGRNRNFNLCLVMYSGGF